MDTPTRLDASTVAFLLAGLALASLTAPFLVVVLAAIVAVVVTYPLYRAARTRLPAWASASVLTLAVVLVIVLPLTFAGWMATRQVIDVAAAGVQFASEGGVVAWIDSIVAQLPEQVTVWLADPSSLQSVEQAIEAMLRDLFADLLNRAGPLLTNLVSAVAGGVVQAGVFIVVLWSLYVEGPTLAATLRRISPLPDAQMARLYTVFEQFAWNVVVGMLATSAGQGLVAAIGFRLVGASNIALLGILTGITSQVPLVGAAVVWVPVAVSYLVEGHWGSALFVAVWSLALTASVDNVLKPFIYRHGLPVHPALVLVSLLGGLLTFGPAGLLVGPFVLVLFLALLTFHDPADGGSEPTSS